LASIVIERKNQQDATAAGTILLRSLGTDLPPKSKGSSHEKHEGEAPPNTAEWMREMDGHVSLDYRRLRAFQCIPGRSRLDAPRGSIRASNCRLNRISPIHMP
jgi:hypothetical protein